MDSHPLLADHLSALAGRLPELALDELTDGLIETWRHHLATGLDPTTAAHAAIAEFGTPQQIIDAFVTQAPGRRIAIMLLLTGPAVGLCWGGSLAAAHAWTWRLPTPAAVGFGLLLVAVVTGLVAAATSRHSYQRTHLGRMGGIGLVALDGTMLAAALLIAPVLVWPMALAIPASVLRVAMTLRALAAPVVHR